jgi:hypothetical protein
MVATLTVTKKEHGIGDVSPEPPIGWQATNGGSVFTIELVASSDYLTGEDDLALGDGFTALAESSFAEDWDSDADAIYDEP